MGYFELVLDSERRLADTGTRQSANFAWSSQTVKSIALKFFGTADLFGSARAVDYVLIWLENGVSDRGVVQPVTSLVSSNSSATFVVPYDVSVTNILFNEASGFEQKYGAKTGSIITQGMSQLTVRIGHNGMTDAAVQAVLGPWVMVLGIETDDQ